MKKILFLGFALACASTAMAQTSTTMVFGNGSTITANGCVISGPMTLTITGQSASVTGGTLGSACAPGGVQQGGVSTASLSLSSTTFTLGSGSVPTLTLSSTDSAVTCNVSGSDGFSSAMTAGRAVSINTPTTAPATITYTASGCSTTTQTAGVTNTVTLLAPTAVLAVSPAGGGGNPNCSSSDTASIFGLSLTRMCSGQVNWQYPVSNLSFNGDLSSVDKLLIGTWGAYKKTQGKAFSISLASGTYVSFALTPTDATHGLQWAANTTYGDGGTIWLSTTPGGPPINNGACLQSANGSNSVLIYPFPGYNCSVAVNTTYYVNIADVAAGGTMQCSNGGSSCGSSIISYTTY